jgi:hypothetical protein
MYVRNTMNTMIYKKNKKINQEKSWLNFSFSLFPQIYGFTHFALPYDTPGGGGCRCFIKCINS